MAITPPAEAPPTSKLHKGAQVDQIGQRGRCIARAAGGGDKNFRKNRQQKNRLDHHHDRDGARQMRQNDEAEELHAARAIHSRGFHLLAVKRLHGGEQDERCERNPLPGDNDRDRGQRQTGEPVDGTQAQAMR